MIKTILRTLWIPLLTACSGQHDDSPSASLELALEGLTVTCQDLQNDRFSRGYWLRSVLDGWGLLIITENHSADSYTLSLMAHGQERAMETRIIECSDR